MTIFASLDTPSLFIASPGDMVRLRLMASNIFEDMSRQGGRSVNVQIYKYEDAELEDTDSKPIQELICRPDDKLSEGIVAFFGEKVGKELHSKSDKTMLSDLPDLMTGKHKDGKSYRLVHPWEEGAEETGGFPLTGSTFEVLCGIAGHQRLEAQGSPKKLPTFVCFASPRDVLDVEDAEDAAWGNDRLWNKTAEQFKSQKKKLRKEQEFLVLQRQMLANFAQYLNLNGHELRFIDQDDEIESAYRKWLRNNGLTGSHNPIDINPFMGLRCYDVKDRTAYFGREDEVEEAVSLAEGAFDNPEAPQFYWIKGVSGVGKSSFLRAGLIGELESSPRAAGRYAHVVFRPNQLLSKAALTRTNDPLKAMFDMAFEAVSLTFLHKMPAQGDKKGLSETYNDLKPEARGAWVAKTLDRLVTESEPEQPQQPHRLIIGVDQFEEIVDMLHDKAQKDQWASFVDFLGSIPNDSRLFLAATLRHRRLKRMRKHEKLGPLWNKTSCHEYELKVPSTKDLRGIMQRPFETIGHSFLADDLIAHLLSQVSSIQSAEEGRLAGRVMPLVSLVLEQIHLEVGEPSWKRKHETVSVPKDADGVTDASAEMKAAATLKDYDNTPVEITLKKAKAHADLDTVIAKLAGFAMEEAKRKNALKPQDSTLDDLLRKLVHWVGDSEEDDTQFSLPGIQMPTRGDEAQIARALRKFRLLMDEGEGKVRLVHETVLKKWPEAVDFMERERPLYRIGQKMRWAAEGWKQGETVTQYQLDTFGEAAGDMLGLWSHRFNTYFTPNLEEKEADLRDYCLALLQAMGTPRATVEKSKYKTPHLHLASFYGRADILREMLEKDKKAISLTRDDNRTALIAPCFVCDHKVLDTLLEFGAKAEQEADDGYYPVHFAAIGGDVAYMEKLIDNGAELHGMPCHPLHIAASNGRDELIGHLIETHKVDADCRAKNGWTPVMYAAAENKCESLNKLSKYADLEVTVDPDAKQPFGMTALHIAAANGALEFVKELISLGVSVDKTNVAGATPLHFAVQHGHPVTAGYLAKEMIKSSKSGANPKMNYAWDSTAAQKIKDELAKKVPNDAQVKLVDWTPLHVAVHRGDYRCVSALIEAGADPNVPNRKKATPLSMAISEGQEKCAMLLAKVSDLTVRDGVDDTPLQAAVKREDLTLAMEIASNEPGRKFDFVHQPRVTDTQKLTLLHKSAADGFTNITRFLLNSDLPEDMRDVFGRSPLHVAAVNGQVEQISLLLAHGGFDLRQKDAKGHTPLDLACLAGRYRSAALLIDGIEGLSENHPHLMHYAAEGGSSRLVMRLSELGFATDAAGEDGLTPLMIAAKHDHEEIVRWLLARDEVNPQRPVHGRDDVTAHTLAALSGAAASLALLIENTGVKSLPLKPLVWQAVEHARYDCAALLLEAAGAGDFADPVSKIRLSVYYNALRAKRRQQFPSAPMGNATRLENILFPPEAPEAAEDGKPQSPTNDDGAAENAPVRPLARPVVQPSTSTELITQSRKYGLASDIYAQLDRDKVMWKPVEGEELTGFIDQINPVDGRHKLNPETVSCHWRQLPWYDSVALLQVTDPGLNNPDLALCYLTDQGNLFRLNGTSPPIHEVNAKAPIKINEQNVADYMRFFCFFVRGEEGPFYLIEDANDPLAPTKDQTLRSVIEGTARPISFDGMNDKGHYLMSAVVYYSNAIFIAQFAVQPTGMIEMLDDEPIAADLPLKINCPLS